MRTGMAEYPSHPSPGSHHLPSSDLEPMALLGFVLWLRHGHGRGSGTAGEQLAQQLLAKKPLSVSAFSNQQPVKLRKVLHLLHSSFLPPSAH